MTKIEIIKNLVECKTKTDKDVSKLRADEICEIIEDLPDDTVEKLGYLDEFLKKYTQGTASRLDDIDEDFRTVHDKLKELKRKKDKIKNDAVQVMRQTKKKGALIVIVLLATIMGAVIALGILSAFNRISPVWCNIVGVLDTVLGITFFIYEYCDDKFQESNIANGDYDTIRRYQKKSTTGDISNTGSNSINITGKVKGNISTGINEDTLKELFK